MAFGEKGTSYISWQQGIFFGLILESKGYLYYDPNLVPRAFPLKVGGKSPGNEVVMTLLC